MDTLNVQPYLYAFLGLYLISEILFNIFSKGSNRRSTYLRTRRFILGACVAVLPACMAQVSLDSVCFLLPLVIGILWMIEYPLLYFLTNHNTSTEFQFYFEAVFGLYLLGWLSSLYIVAINICDFYYMSHILVLLITAVEVAVIVILIMQLVYYGLYGTCINELGMQLVQEAHYNEIIDFFKSMKRAYSSLIFIGTLGIMFYIQRLNNQVLLVGERYDYTTSLVMLMYCIVLGWTIWKRHNGVFVRTEIMQLVFNVYEYRIANNSYRERTKERMANLKVKKNGAEERLPHTIVVVIGESATRDHMKVFNDEYCYDNTPWMSSMANSNGSILFQNAFSCFGSTVASLSMALTEYNQYDNGEFKTSCSIIDIAHKLNYKVWWYSNQGHLGANDTPVTLVAETAEVSKWTKQELNKVQYDEELLDYLQAVDMEQNNFVVIHLKGSHFPYTNRYPRVYTKFKSIGKQDLNLSYANSIYYTDCILKKIFEYTQEKLNLHSFIYFSDHGVVPDKYRTPNFDGIGKYKIPLFIYFSDSYIVKNLDVYKTLCKHKDKYWTNDLAYELICGILNIKSNRYNPDNSLASPTYKFEKEELLINGDRRIWE